MGSACSGEERGTREMEADRAAHLMRELHIFEMHQRLFNALQGSLGRAVLAPVWQRVCKRKEAGVVEVETMVASCVKQFPALYEESVVGAFRAIKDADEPGTKVNVEAVEKEIWNDYLSLVVSAMRTNGLVVRVKETVDILVRIWLHELFEIPRNRFKPGGGAHEKLESSKRVTLDAFVEAFDTHLGPTLAMGLAEVDEVYFPNLAQSFAERLELKRKPPSLASVQVNRIGELK